MSKVLMVEFTDALMRWFDEFPVPSADRQSVFYFRVPDDWLAGSDELLQQRVYTVAQKMYEDLNAHFRAAEPLDTSYMVVHATKAVPLDDEQAAEAPWMNAPNPAVWEPTPCVVVEDEATYEKVSRESF